ncbi:hypothetical protein F8388_017551 [Cannabis sativa]|uniref:Uncharacterized protein n=1 Tax=Cannabis sativa TaxID=3483 RepID=A0A7J6I7X5_CANSA|nr:hypothetical protein F8388_017551 [Cannabis sativa]KAF4403704.1 hypothetical protein G4B88_002557 [Cannabis sativa]
MPADSTNSASFFFPCFGRSTASTSGLFCVILAPSLAFTTLDSDTPPLKTYTKRHKASVDVALCFKVLKEFGMEWVIPSQGIDILSMFIEDVVRSAIGFTVFTTLLSSWALTFSIGGTHLFGPVWDQLVMYNLADKLGLTNWS